MGISAVDKLINIERLSLSPSLKLGDGQLHFKLFFKINENGSRQPDLTARFPIIVNSKGTARLAMEFENLEVPVIHEGTLKGELIVLTGEEKVAKDCGR